jgi:hypothetical protein
MGIIKAVIDELLDGINRCLNVVTFLSVIHHMEGPMESIQQQELIQDKVTAQYLGYNIDNIVNASFGIRHSARGNLIAISCDYGIFPPNHI